MSDVDRSKDCTSSDIEGTDAAPDSSVILGLKRIDEHGSSDDVEADEIRSLTQSGAGRSFLGGDGGMSGGERLSFTEANLGQSPSVDLFGRFESFSLTRGSECDSDLLSTSSIEDERKADDKEYVEDWIKTLPDDFRSEPGTEIGEAPGVEQDDSSSMDEAKFQEQGDVTLPRRQSEPYTRAGIHGAAKRRRRPGNPEDLARGEGGKRSEISYELLDPVQERIAAAHDSGSVRLELNRQGLQDVPPSLLEINQLKFLYLEGNELSAIPEDFFPCLPHLQWLDLRNNQLSSLPLNIGQHKELKTILLENNLIEELPVELALIPSLQGMNYRNNPLVDPPPEVLERGIKDVLDYLRQKSAALQERQLKYTRPQEEDSSSLDTKSPSVRSNTSIKKRSVSWTGPEVANAAATPNRRIPYVMDAEYDGPSPEVLDEKARQEEESIRQRQEKERIESIIQNVKSSLALKSWRTKAKIEQMKMMKMADNYEGFIVAEAPFDIDDDYINIPTREQLIKSRDSNETRKRPTPTPGYLDAERISKEKEVETQIKCHLERLIETSEQEVIDLDRATRELQEVERLRRHLTNLFRVYY